MADPLDNTANNVNDINQETRFLIDAVTSLSEKIKQAFEEIVDGMSGSTEGLDRVFKQYERDFVSANRKIITSLDKQFELQDKINKKQDVSKEIEKEKQRIATQKQVIDTRLEQLVSKAPGLAEKLKVEYALQLELAEKNLEVLEAQNNNTQNNIPLTTKLGGALKGNLDKIDKTGTLSKLFGKNMSEALTPARQLEIALMAIVKGILDASATAATLRQETGLSAEASYDLRGNFASISTFTENSFINVERLAKGFVELSKTTGLVADFGGQTLETFTSLNQQLGLGAKEAANLSLYARLQSQSTEQVLSDTVDTVGAMIKENGVALNTKTILNDIASASAATAVSLGKNPQLLAEAAVQARLLGTNLATVDQIAGSLLNFEQSISAELEAELLTGKQLNLEKARLAALNNDLATLSEEIANNEAITESFATGNRIQQEALAASLGLQRDQLAEIALQQELNNLSAEEFKNIYGEVTYQQLQSRSIQERLADSLAKISELAANIGAVIAPFVDIFAAVTSNALVLQGALVGIGVRAAFIARQKIIDAISSIFSASFTMNPILGAALAGAGVGLLISQVNKAQSIQSVEDGFADEGGPFRITNAYGKTSVTKAGDKVAVSPNMEYGGGNNSEMVSLLKTIASKNTNFSIGPQNLGTGMNLYTYNV